MQDFQIAALSFRRGSQRSRQDHSALPMSHGQDLARTMLGIPICVFYGIVLPLLMAGCGEASPTNIEISPSDAPLPTATLLPPPPTQVIAPSIFAPQGNTATIDGILSSDEWDTAKSIALASGELLLMHDGIYLYVGIRSENLGLGSVCVYWDDEISILHSSAALGTAVYGRADEEWVRTRSFNWTNRETSNSQQAVNNRAEHLERENWLASNGRMGNSNEMEYQITMTNSKVLLGVAYLLSPDYETTDFWPDTLGTGCRNFEPLPGNPPETASFSPDTWITVIASNE
jgi:hypothetical protein